MGAEAGTERDRPVDKKWWTLVAVCAGVFTLLLDVTIVIMAQPSIQAGLPAGFGDVEFAAEKARILAE